MSTSRTIRTIDIRLKAAAIRSILAEPPWPLLSLISLSAWVVMFTPGPQSATAAFCLTPLGDGYDMAWRTFRITLAQFSPLQMAGSWCLMLVAMMTPILAAPLRHLWIGSLRQRRWRAIGLFLAAYLSVWMVVAPMLILAIFLLQRVEVTLAMPTFISALAVTLLWQASPAKQRWLNRCHWLPRLSPFGWAADYDCIHFGLVNAARCVATCWALMMLPLAAGTLHAPAMLLVFAIMIWERLQPARACRWHLPLLAGARG